MRLLSNFVHSKHKQGVSVFVGPRTFTNSKRRWQIRLIIDLPFESGATQRPVIRITLDTSVMPYWSAAAFAKAEMAKALVEHAEWTDFTWQVWVP